MPCNQPIHRIHKPRLRSKPVHMTQAHRTRVYGIFPRRTVGDECGLSFLRFLKLSPWRVMSHITCHMCVGDIHNLRMATPNIFPFQTAYRLHVHMRTRIDSLLNIWRLMSANGFVENYSGFVPYGSFHLQAHRYMDGIRQMRLEYANEMLKQLTKLIRHSYINCRVDHRVLLYAPTPAHVSERTRELRLVSLDATVVRSIAREMWNVCRVVVIFEEGMNNMMERLTRLPDELAECKQVREVVVGGHDLKEFPEVLFGMHGLRKVELRENATRVMVPHDVDRRLPGLEMVMVDGCVRFATGFRRAPSIGELDEGVRLFQAQQRGGDFEK